MNESNPSQVFRSDHSDPEMRRANEQARATFRYFWRELAWERRRIIPGLDLACVKAPFSDVMGPDGIPADASDVEHMWLNEIDFDGQFVSGVLLNAPIGLQGFRQGDAVRIPLSDVGDWMYVIGGEVFGAYTVNFLRSRMERKERQAHDAAWGLKFGDPSVIRVAPDASKSGGFLKSLFDKKPPLIPEEHPMSENMAATFRAQLAQDASIATWKDDRGWTHLHHFALAGSVAAVQALLEAGADPHALTDHGMTPLQLAQALGWDRVATLLLTPR